jgi:hypothetical protein
MGRPSTDLERRAWLDDGRTDGIEDAALDARDVGRLANVQGTKVEIQPKPTKCQGLGFRNLGSVW